MATYESRRYNTPVPAASKIADGSVNNTEFQHLDGVTSDIQSQFTGKLPLAGGTMTGDLNFGDNVDINVGAGADLKILHDGSNSTIHNTTGTLKVLADTLQLKNNADNETLATFANGGAANLRFNNGTKLETTNTGVNVTGELGATGNITSSGNVNGNGQNLTNLNASNLASGTVADARISTLTSSKLTGPLPAIDGSALTGISSAPSSLTAVGAIREFTIVTTQQAWVSASLSVGTTVTPSTVTFGQSYMVLSDAYQGTSSRRYKVGSTPEQMIGTRTTITGTWKCLTQLTATGSGQGQGFSGSSMPGLLQRIS